MKKEYIITIMLLVMLVAGSTPTAVGACTCDVVTTSACACGTSGTVAGTVHVESEHFTGGDKTPDADFYVPSGTIKWARVYWTIWGGNPGDTGWSNATFCDASNSWTNNRFIDDNCAQTETDGWYKGGSGSHFLYWNVTDKVSAGKNSLSVDQSGWSIDGRCYDIILVVVLDDGSSQTKYWINQGYDLPSGTDATWFNGTIDNTDHTLHHFAYGDNDAWTLKFNDVAITSYPSTGGLYRAMETVEIVSSRISGNAQKMEWDGWDGNFHPNLAILVGNDDFLHPDLEIKDTKIERLNDSNQVPTEFVVGHIYDVDVLIKNRGGTDASGTFKVSLYDNGTRVSNTTVNGLAHGASKWVTLQWHPTTSGTHTLRAMVDSDNDVNDESIESNNNMTQYDDVLMNDATSADLYPEMRVLPAWRSNKTEIVVKMYNGGTTDADNFDVSATNANSLLGTSVYAKAYREVRFTTTTDLVNCSDYTVTVVLDTGGDVGEGNEGNNTASKNFHAVDVRLKVTHHYGNASTYNGVLSSNNDAAMIDVARVIPNCVTPYDLLGSEADIMGGTGLPEYVYGINKSANKGTSTWYLNESGTQDTTCPSGRQIYWYGFINGIPMPGMPDPMDEYLFGNPGEVMHMDLLKYVNSGSGTDSFRPRPIMNFPEPFLHGYGGTRWNTIIAYPTGYSAKADAIKTKLESCGVSGVSTKLASTMTAGDKSGNNLILLGTPTENSIIGEINADHTEAGMPMYFDATDPNAIRLYDDQLYNGDDPDVPDCCSHQNSAYHSVIMACDNPFDNAATWTNTWMDADKSVWIVSGVTIYYAEEAADTLASGNLGDKGFWTMTRKCGDVTGEGQIAMNDAIAITQGKICTSKWAADVDCSTTVAMNDAIDITQGSLYCCGDCC